METIELTAATLDDARRMAAAELGVDPTQINITVLEEKKGLFGRAGTVKVKAERVSAPEPVAPAKPEPAAEPEPEPEPVVEAAAPEDEEAPEPAKPVKRGRKKAAEAVVEAPAAEDAKEEAEEAAPVETGEAAPVAATQEDADRMIGYLNEIFALGDLKVKADAVSLNGKYINIEIDGRDVGYLVGKRGEILNALQYVGNVISNRQIGSGVRVVIDGNKYRAKRAEILERQAREIAEQVKLNGMEALLDPLPAFERRLVHQALSEYPGVVTYSEGEEPNRRVVIAPAE
jgi:spoIIIJ-associated protein